MRSRLWPAPRARRQDHDPRPNAAETHARRSALAFELILLSAAWLTYFGIRALTEGRREEAIANGRDVLALERDLGIAWEGEFQATVTDYRWLVDLANWIYIWGHWPAIAVTAIWLFSRHVRAYQRLRDAFFASGAIGLLIFALLPVAPPRLLEAGLVDTVTSYSTSYRALQPPALTNIYAAMPSLHFGWDLLVGIAIVQRATTWRLRIVGLAMPVAMAYAVVATANHYVLDVVAGGALALVGVAVAIRLQPNVDDDPPAVAPAAGEAPGWQPPAPEPERFPPSTRQRA
jgi:hypothetical protein